MKKGGLFYAFYFIYILLFGIAVFYLSQSLSEWLQAYEAAQPQIAFQKIYREFFAEPDWGTIYDLAGIEDTCFEGRESYITYMSQKMASEQLTCSETAAGTADQKKYILKLGEEKVLSFTMRRNGRQQAFLDWVQQSFSEHRPPYFPEWSLGEITAYFSRSQSVRIETWDGHTVCLNGIALDDTYTIQKEHTLEDAYLPEGISVPHRIVQQAEGFLLRPEITITDEAGLPLEIIYDAKNDLYREKETEDAEKLSPQEEQAVLDVAEGYCAYMLNIFHDLPSLFDPDSQIYKKIRGSDRWAMQKFEDYYFEGEQITDYCRYNEDIFLARVTLSLNVIRLNGSVKKYPMDTAFWFKRQKDGGIRAFEITNRDIRRIMTEVRLVWRDDDAIWKTEFVSADTDHLTAPPVQVPKGCRFAGWMRETRDREGKITRTLLFVPDEEGRILLPKDYRVEPMVLYPLFEQTADN